MSFTVDTIPYPWLSVCTKCCFVPGLRQALAHTTAVDLLVALVMGSRGLTCLATRMSNHVPIVLPAFIFWEPRLGRDPYPGRLPSCKQTLHLRTQSNPSLASSETNHNLRLAPRPLSRVHSGPDHPSRYQQWRQRSVVERSSGSNHSPSKNVDRRIVNKGILQNKVISRMLH